MLLYHQPPSHLTSSRPRLALDINLDTYNIDNQRLPKPYRNEQYEQLSLYSDSNQFHSGSPSPSQPTNQRPSMSFPQPLSAPHDHPNFSHQLAPSYPSSRYGSDRPTYSDLPPPLDRRMSEPALLSGNHPAAYRLPPSVEQSNRYNYAQPSNYSPPDYHRSYTTAHSRNDSTGSSYGAEYRSQWSSEIKQEEGYPEPNPIISSNYSPRPSTASTGVDNISPHPTYSLSAASPTSAVSVSPDLPNISVQQGDDQHSPSSPSNSSKTYAFVSLPGTTIRKRPRRRYDEIERLYHCSWPDCSKAYGTLNHLNAHVVMQKHGARRLPSEFKELRKQWRKAKKEGTFPPSGHNSVHPSASTPSSSSSSFVPSGQYFPPAGAFAGRGRRMTDPSPPPVMPHRSSNIFPSNMGSSNWMEDSSERRYPLSMSYPPSDSAVAEDTYGSFSEHTTLPTHSQEQLGNYRPPIQGYSQAENYTTSYTYPLPSPPVNSSYEPESALQSNVSPPSPDSQPRYTAAINTRLPSDNTLITPLHDHRSGDNEDHRERETHGSRSAGSEYDEPRGSYGLHSHPQSQAHAYAYESYENHEDGASGPYSLGRNRLPRDSTLLTPLNLENMRYGTKGL